MKIKHFFGYGCVNAKKVSLKTIEAPNKWSMFDDMVKLKVKVTGEHERGLVEDTSYGYYYGVWNWLAKRFYKGCKDTDIVDVDIDSIKFEECDYTFIIKKQKNE